MREANSSARVDSRSGCDDLADQAAAVGLLGGDRAAGQHPVGGNAGADDARQVVAHAHLGARKPEQDGRIAERCRRRADPDVGGQAQCEAGADARAVDRGDDRLRHRPDRLWQRGHGLLEPQPVDGGRVGVEHVGSEVAHVDAGAEAAAGAGQHHGVYVQVGSQAAQVCSSSAP